MQNLGEESAYPSAPIGRDSDQVEGGEGGIDEFSEAQLRVVDEEYDMADIASTALTHALLGYYISCTEFKNRRGNQEGTQGFHQEDLEKIGFG